MSQNLSKEIKALQKAVAEIRAMFYKFTIAENQRRKDEERLRRERCWP
jgi:hypothetical protein